METNNMQKAYTLCYFIDYQSIFTSVIYRHLNDSSTIPGQGKEDHDGKFCHKHDDEL